MAILSQRENLEFEGVIESDCAPLQLAGERHAGCMRSHAMPDYVLRDPTRGGVATTLNEIAVRSKVGMQLYENAIPVRESV